LKSNGLHSNGFSLVRKIIEDKKIRIDEPAPFNNKVLLSSSLLTPTRIYVKSCLSVIKNFEIKALAHITGGGITENIPRVLPTGLSVQISSDTWQIPPVFNWLANTGNIDPKEMLRTFNCGIGMVIIIGQKYANEIVMHLEKCGEEASIIGKVTEKSNQSELVEILDLKETFR